MMENKNKNYTEVEIEFLNKLADLIQTQEQLSDIEDSLAAVMKRTPAGVAKQIENRKDWFPNLGQVFQDYTVKNLL